MKSLKHIVQESLRIRINDKPYTASPTTFDELRQIVKERFEELGPGTENEPIDFNDIDVSGMNTFYGGGPKKFGIFQFTKFEYIDISDWDVSNVENMICMFYRCYHLEYIGDLSNWNVSRVKSMESMFYHCKNLKSVGDLSNWDISNVKDISDMFTFSAITNIPDWYKI